jgi:hypothetical protein
MLWFFFCFLVLSNTSMYVLYIYQNIRQLEAALHRECQQLSQQDIRRLTEGMRRRFEAVIQERGGYLRY